MVSIIDRILSWFVRDDKWSGIGEAFQGSPVWERPADNGFHDLPKGAALFAMNNSKCPYCQGALYDGPRGGASQNYYCENVNTCNSAFNLSEMIPEWGQFIGGVPASFANFMHDQDHVG